MKISINTPSYRRPSNVHVLGYLPTCKVWVDESEAEAYRAANPQAVIVACPKGVQGNVARVRNYILDQEFAAGMDAVLLLDDDLHYIERFVLRDNYAYTRERLDPALIMVFLEKYSRMAEEMGAKMWGLNCNPDQMCYKQFQPFSTMSFLGGPFQCFLKGNRCRYDEALPLKEDYDMVLQQVNKERYVLRVNYYHFVCEQSTNKGGCAAMRNREKEAQQFDALVEKWGSDIVKRDKTTHRGGARDKERVFEDYNPVIRIPIKGV